MRRASRKLVFSLLWDLGDWALRKAFELDDSERVPYVRVTPSRTAAGSRIAPHNQIGWPGR